MRFCGRKNKIKFGIYRKTPPSPLIAYRRAIINSKKGIYSKAISARKREFVRSSLLPETATYNTTPPSTSYTAVHPVLGDTGLFRCNFINKDSATAPSPPPFKSNPLSVGSQSVDEIQALGFTKVLELGKWIILFNGFYGILLCKWPGHFLVPNKFILPHPIGRFPILPHWTTRKN